MSIPYAFYKVFAEEEIPLDSTKHGRSPKEQATYLMKDRHMWNQYLGACLDSCRWGGRSTVMWEMDTPELIGFIQNWWTQNDNHTNLFHERTIEDMYIRFELPWITHMHCPVDQHHSERIKDVGGNLRCGHFKKELLRGSAIEEYYPYWDSRSRMQRVSFKEDNPEDRLSDDSSDWTQAEWECVDDFMNETPSTPILDPCYAMVRENRNRILSLEEIMKRLNLAKEYNFTKCDIVGPCQRLDELNFYDREHYQDLEICPGHSNPVKEVIFPFDGWDLAFYVQRWHEQTPTGGAPWFNS